MKKGQIIVSAALALSLAAGMAAGAVDQTAKATASKVLVDGKEISFTAYEINDYNYFKLRDITAAVNGSAKQFAVGWDAAANAISLTSGTAYTPAGGELEPPASMDDAAAKETTSAVTLDGKAQDFEAYEINSYNYFKLRDVCAALDIEVGWDAATQTITLTTTQEEQEEQEEQEVPKYTPEINQPIVRPEGDKIVDIEVNGKVEYRMSKPCNGAVLKFFADQERTQLIGTTTADENGDYSITIPFDATWQPNEIGICKGEAYIETYWVDDQGNKFTNLFPDGEGADRIGNMHEDNIKSVHCNLTANNPGNW